MRGLDHARPRTSDDTAPCRKISPCIVGKPRMPVATTGQYGIIFNLGPAPRDHMYRVCEQTPRGTVHGFTVYSTTLRCAPGRLLPGKRRDSAASEHARHPATRFTSSAAFSNSPMVVHDVVGVELLAREIDLVKEVLGELVARTVAEVALRAPRGSVHHDVGGAWHTHGACMHGVCLRVRGGAKPAPLVRALAASDVVAAAILLGCSRAAGARLGVLADPRRALDLLEDLVAVLAAEHLLARLVGRSPAHRQVGAGCQAVPGLLALGAEAKLALAAERQPAALLLQQRGVLAARAPDHILHARQRGLQRDVLEALPVLRTEALAHLVGRRLHLASRVGADHAAHLALAHLGGEVAADAAAAEGVPAAQEAHAVEARVLLHADAAGVRRARPRLLLGALAVREERREQLRRRARPQQGPALACGRQRARRGGQPHGLRRHPRHGVRAEIGREGGVRAEGLVFQPLDPLAQHLRALAGRRVGRRLLPQPIEPAAERGELLVAEPAAAQPKGRGRTRRVAAGQPQPQPQRRQHRQQQRAHVARNLVIARGCSAGVAVVREQGSGHFEARRRGQPLQCDAHFDQLRPRAALHRAQLIGIDGL
eukprot:scaffold66040_cov60-Phaeocystis_antarctica.AAC.3